MAASRKESHKASGVELAKPNVCEFTPGVVGLGEKPRESIGRSKIGTGVDGHVESSGDSANSFRVPEYLISLSSSSASD